MKKQTFYLLRKVSSHVLFVIAAALIACIPYKSQAKQYRSDPGAHASGVDTCSNCNSKGRCDVEPNPGSCIGTVVIHEDWQTDPNDNTKLIITFSLAELRRNRPDQLPYILDPSHTYQFDQAFPLTDQKFAPLGLMPNAWIDPQDQTNVSIDGDVVTLTIHYSYDLSRPAPLSVRSSTHSNSKWAVYPNPCGSTLTIDAEQYTREGRYQIFDMLGREVNSGIITEKTSKIDVNSLTSGMYTISISGANDQKQVMQFMKQ